MNSHEPLFDLRTEPWIPFRRRSGRIDIGSPALLTDSIEDDPVVAIASGRPDFDGALTEFLIGLLTVSLQPLDEDDWLAKWKKKDAPSPATLADALGALPAAFYLDGDGDRFLQDQTVSDFAECEVHPAQELIIPMAGGNDYPIDTHPYVKPSRITTLGRPAAAMALITVQTYSPAAGRGYRTGLRGGGPLTTLVEPRFRLTRTGSDDQRAQTAGELLNDRPLWQMLWANVETLEQVRQRADLTKVIFSWMQPTRVSAGKPPLATTPSDVNPLHAYFPMPRRLRLEFGESTGVCDLTHATDSRPVVGIRTLPYGPKYEAWQHPLSPHYRKNAAHPYLPAHGQPGGVGWNDWLGLTLSTPDENRVPAQCVAHFRASRAGAVKLRHFGVHAFGYDVSNAKARDWCEANLPAFFVDDEAALLAIRTIATQFVEATGIAAYAAQNAVDRALYERPEDVSGDRTLVRSAIWSAMHSLFYELIENVATDPINGERDRDARVRFRDSLAREAESAFDRVVMAGSYQEHPRRVVSAKYGMVTVLRGYSKLGEKLFKSLGLPVVKTVRAAGIPQT